MRASAMDRSSAPMKALRFESCVRASWVAWKRMVASAARRSVMSETMPT